ncbi:uncharacterized protein ACR2FA_002291 [Aphomia sociella]
MAERLLKTPESASPVARAGAGDISERELSRERHNLQTTPPKRVQPAHPKKQVFSTPVNKFTAKSSAPSPNLARIRSCLDEYRSRTPARAAKIGPKALSMEDLTPTKRIKKEKSDKDLPVLMSPGLHTAVEVRAAARIGRFLMLSAWRKRRDEVRCLRKTLEFQVSCSERLRIQVTTLKSLLDSDNAKVRLAMRELERLKQLVRDKDTEKAVLEREKMALENDVCAAEDQVSEMSIGWRNCRNELDGVRAAAAACERALALERASAAAARAQRDHACSRHAYQWLAIPALGDGGMMRKRRGEESFGSKRRQSKLSTLEDEVSQYEALLSSAEQEAAALRHDADEKQRALQQTKDQLLLEQEARERSCHECAVLSGRVTLAAQETAALKLVLAELRAELQRLAAELAVTREQLDWWPRPLTRLVGAARWWLRRPLCARAALLWALTPERHGC